MENVVYFKGVIGIYSYNEETKKIKLTKENVLIKATDFEDASKKIKERYKDCAYDWILFDIVTTKFVDFIE